MEFHSVSRRISMNTDRKILLPRAEVVEKNNSMNAVVYQSRVSIIQWIETMQRVSTIDCKECKTTLFIDSRMFGNLKKNYLAIDLLRKTVVYARIVTEVATR